MDFVSRSTQPASTGKDVVFQVGETSFSLTSEIMNSVDVANSGLADVVSKKGFKEIPPVVPRTASGGFILPREPESFSLLIEHLLGLQPLANINISDFPENYMRLKNELAYWAIPTENLKLPTQMWTRMAWTDENCFYPIPSSEWEKHVPHLTDEPVTSKIIKLNQVNEAADLDAYIDGDKKSWVFFEAENVGIFGATTDRMILKIPRATNPCIQYGNFPLRKSKTFIPFVFLPHAHEILLVWSPSIFIHIRMNRNLPASIQCQTFVKEESWLCFHPIAGMILSGHKGPIPHIYSFNMPKANIIKFYPWGALAIQKNVDFNTSSSSVNESSGSQSSSKSPAVGVCVGRMMRLGSNGRPFKPLNINLNFDSTTAAAAAVVSGAAGGAADSTKDMNEEAEVKTKPKGNPTTKTFVHVKDYDLSDRRSENGMFRCYLMMTGSLAVKDCDAEGYEENAVFVVNADGLVATQPSILIKTGCPIGQQLQNFYLLGQYSVDEEKYYRYDVGQKLLDFNQKFAMQNNAGGVAPDTCTVQ